MASYEVAALPRPDVSTPELLAVPMPSWLATGTLAGVAAEWQSHVQPSGPTAKLAFDRGSPPINEMQLAWREVVALYSVAASAAATLAADSAYAGFRSHALALIDAAEKDEEVASQAEAAARAEALRKEIAASDDAVKKLKQTMGRCDAKREQLSKIESERVRIASELAECEAEREAALKELSELYPERLVEVLSAGAAKRRTGDPYGDIVMYIIAGSRANPKLGEWYNEKTNTIKGTKTAWGEVLKKCEMGAGCERTRGDALARRCEEMGIRLSGNQVERGNGEYSRGEMRACLEAGANVKPAAFADNVPAALRQIREANSAA